jgi:hypothetical protein
MEKGKVFGDGLYFWKHKNGHGKEKSRRTKQFPTPWNKA